FIDARDEEEFAEGHIKGAILAPSTPELVQLFPDRSSPIVTYCSGGDCDVSMELAEQLMFDWEYERIFVYLGGWPEWKAKGYPTH
ncbi:MAG TPA: rhodanese-like domain-containing protein, partial [Candidatus Marinimicrobia bacterium]|nr:rhodanese-like domain-containing protein [Candidatus Neomarinimicrobiota bacterium]